MAQERIELFDVALLDEHRPIVDEMQAIRRQLNLGIGWHYLLDLAWIAANLDIKPGMTILDAGAGQGMLQWWASKHGANVISVDRVDRPHFYLRPEFRRWAHINGLRPEDRAIAQLRDVAPEMLVPPTWRDYMPPRYPWKLHHWPDKLRRAQERAALIAGDRLPGIPPERGTITLYNHDLVPLSDIEDNSVDAVLSLSSLEHNTFEGTQAANRELMRVLKPGGRFIVTVSAARDEDWYHEQNKGWCYTETTLKRLFALPDAAPSNYADYDVLFQKLRDCAELRDDLDPLYTKSGDNGMPWGKWDPTYHPVGIFRIKD